MVTATLWEHLPNIGIAVGLAVTTVISWMNGQKALVNRKIGQEAVENSKENTKAIEEIKVSINGRVEQLIETLNAEHIARLEAALAQERARNLDPRTVARRAAAVVRRATVAEEALKDVKALTPAPKKPRRSRVR